MVPEFIFETKGLGHAYSNSKKESIKDISIKIKKGKKTILLGANGAGKSTLFYHFNGVFKPKEGSVYYNGEPLSYDKEDLKKLRSEVAVVLQNPDDQIFSATVEEDVAFGLLNMGIPHDEVDKRIDEVLFIVGLSDCRMKPTQQLSYGQRKRIAFAGALATRPKVLILDEPTAGLDPQMAQEIMEIADQLHHMGTDVIISTHDVDLAYAWADEIHVLRNGTLVYSGDSEGFYSDPVQVSMSGLMSPSMFAINVNIAAVDGRTADPYPRTRAQLLSKMSSKDIKAGTVFTMSVGDSIDQEMVDKILLRAGDNAAVGIFGTDARKLAFEVGLRLDYVFNGVENCIIDALLGNNSVIIHDNSVKDIVIQKISDIRKFGVDICMDGD
jgi:cobalt/nickel transport system ATP-binding protein